VHSPAGLDIGARTAGEIALSIMAEVVSTRVHSAAPDATDHNETEHGRQAAAAPVTAIDPVCGMTVAAVDASLHVDHDGSRFYFCGPGCLRAFSANPQEFPADAAPTRHDEQHARMVAVAGYAES
jgi:xanthine dehydrogenase accessory factor